MNFIDTFIDKCSVFQIVENHFLKLNWRIIDKYLLNVCAIQYKFSIEVLVYSLQQII